MKREVLYETKWLQLLNLTDPDNGIDGYVCTHSTWTNGQGIAVLPFRLVSSLNPPAIGLTKGLEPTIGGKPTEFLLRQEVTPCWGGEPCLSAITGGMDKEGEAFLDCAQRELYEESGYLIGNVNLWTALGPCRPSKSSTTVMHLFAVDLTDIEQLDPPGDGSELEAKAWCEWRLDPWNAVDALTGLMIYRLGNGDPLKDLESYRRAVHE